MERIHPAVRRFVEEEVFNKRMEELELQLQELEKEEEEERKRKRQAPIYKAKYVGQSDDLPQAVGSVSVMPLEEANPVRLVDCIDRVDAKAKTLYPGIPVPPYVILATGPRTTGKTNTCIDLLTDPNKIGGYFDIHLLFCRTYRFDKTKKWQNLRLPLDQVSDSFDERYLTNLIHDIMELSVLLGHKLRPKINLIFDDMIDEGIFKRQREGPLETITIKGRHCDISMMVLTQGYMKVSKINRTNATNILVFSVNNRKELENIALENMGELDERTFEQCYRLATARAYNFLHINNQKPDPTKRLGRNWDEQILAPVADWAAMRHNDAIPDYESDSDSETSYLQDSWEDEAAL